MSKSEALPILIALSTAMGVGVVMGFGFLMMPNRYAPDDKCESWIDRHIGLSILIVLILGMAPSFVTSYLWSQMQ